MATLQFRPPRIIPGADNPHQMEIETYPLAHIFSVVIPEGIKSEMITATWNKADDCKRIRLVARDWSLREEDAKTFSWIIEFDTEDVSTKTTPPAALNPGGLLVMTVPRFPRRYY